MSLSALLFDFDGLVCDTESAARESWQDAYRGHGQSFPDGLWALMRGRHDGELLALEDLGARLGRPVTAREAADRRARKAELARTRPLLPGVARLLDETAGRGLKVALVTSAPSAWVEPHLLRLGVRHRFGPVVTGDLPLRNKPAPDLYLRALDELGVPAHAALALEDSPTGVRAALAASVRCVAVPGERGAAPAAFTGVAAIVPTLESLTLDSLERLSHDELPHAAAG